MEFDNNSGAHENHQMEKRVSSNLRKTMSLMRGVADGDEKKFNHSTNVDTTFLNGKDRGMQGIDSQLLKELSEDNVDESIIGEEIDQDYDLRAITCRQKLIHFLHTVPVEVFLMVLVILDVLIILTLVVLDMDIVAKKLHLLDEMGEEVLVHMRDSWPEVNPYELNYNSTNVGTAYEYMVKNSIKDSPYESKDYVKGHDIHKRAVKPKKYQFGEESTYKAAKAIYMFTKVNHILHFGSIAVLATLCTEVFLKIFGYGLHYFQNKWEVADGVITVISLALDIAITDQVFSHEVGKVVLVSFLMWRVIRVLNAIVLGSRVRTMFRLRVVRKSKRIAEDHNKVLQIDVNDLQAEVRQLRVVAKSHGALSNELRLGSVSSE